MTTDNRFAAWGLQHVSLPPPSKDAQLARHSSRMLRHHLRGGRARGVALALLGAICSKRRFN